MSKIGRLWAGRMFGTNTGNLAADLTSTDDGFTGTLRFLDDKFGPVVYGVRGTFEDGLFRFSGSPEQLPDGVQAGDVVGTGKLVPEGAIRGEWNTTAGTGGMFVLHPHDIPVETKQTSQPPEQIQTATRTLGAVRLYADDFRALLEAISKEFAQPRVVVTYREHGSEHTKYSDDFAANMQRLGTLRFIQLNIQEPDLYGVRRSVTVALDAAGQNEVRVQGVQESWVIGKAEAVALHLRRHEKVLATTFRKFGLNINGLMVIFTIVLLPELPVWRRFLFVTIVAVLVVTVVQVHTRLIPNASINLSEGRSSLVGGAWPQTASWLIAASSALVASIAYGLLKGELSEVVQRILSLF